MYEKLGTIEKTSFAPFLSAYASRHLEKFRWRLFQLGSRSSQVEHSMMPCSPNGPSTYQHSSSPHPNFEFLGEALETFKFKTAPSMSFKPPTKFGTLNMGTLFLQLSIRLDVVFRAI
jgi:hypothetical protein